MAKKLYQIDTGEEVDIKDLINQDELSMRGGGRRKLSKQQHRVLWPFLILSLVLVIFVGSYWYGNIRQSVRYTLPDFIKEQLTSDKTEEQQIAELKNKDTDHDSLTDYAELYQYNTSMFLEDTDSDGISDYDEVTKGMDPLCPEGQSCSLLKLITPESHLADVLRDVSVDQNLTLQQAALNEFRKFLIDNGMSKEEVDSLSDDDLLSIIQLADEENILPAESMNASTTPEQVREFLLSQPDADQTRIKELSNEELLTIKDQLLSGQ
ncbi:MAG: thrombospondin type 3 repeat-containing protein [Patescibacteria group bacterium]